MTATRRQRRIGRILLTTTIAILAATQSALAAGVTWSPSVAVGPAQRAACGHALAAGTTASGTALHATYTSVGGTYRDEKVFYRRSRDNGATWRVGATITSNTSVWKECPTVAAAGSLVVVAWRQGTLTATAIRLRVSADGGSTWGAERRLPTTRAPGKPSVAVSGTRIFVAWTDGSGAQRWSRVAVTRDRGVTWTSRVLDAHPTSPDIGAQATTQVAASGTRVFAAWMRVGGTRLIGRVSVDSGATWQPPSVLAATFAPFPLPGVFPKLQSRFAIAARPDRMAVAWTGPWTDAMDDVPSLFVRVFAGGAWRAPATLTVPPPAGDPYPYGYVSSPVVTLLASTRVGLAWNACHDYRSSDPMFGCGETYGGDFDPHWAESSNNGVAWTDPVIIDPDAVFGTITAISAVWTSANLRGVLITRWNGEPDWDVHLRFSRGAGLP
jgi:BNR repeat protein